MGEGSRLKGIGSYAVVLRVGCQGWRTEVVGKEERLRTYF